MIVIKETSELEQARKDHPNEPIQVQQEKGPWLVFVPGSDRPRLLPHGGLPKARYTDDKVRPY